MRIFTVNKTFLLQVYTTSLTIFAMLFGAGNLMFPLRLGMESGSQTIFSLAGFLVTGVMLPLIGLLAIIGFSGHYETFFARVGRIPGFLLTLFCMMVIGPFIAMPRIVTLSYEMLQPFLPVMPVWIFALLFLSMVFAAAYRPVKLLDIIGKVLSPLKVFSLLIIVLIGVIKGVDITPSTESASVLFLKGINFGYYTLDLLSAIFFGSIIVSLLTKYAPSDEKISVKNAVAVAGVSSVCAALLLAGVYAGMSLLGAYHGHGLEALNEGQIFSAISFKVLGSWGAALIGFTVFLACFTTTVSLSAVVTDYVRRNIVCNKIDYAVVLGGILSLTAFFSYFGLAGILKYSVPVILASYPIFIVITLCNLAYKVVSFKYIKIPTLIMALIMACSFL